LQPPPKRKNGKKENHSEGGHDLSIFRFRDAPDSPLFVQVLTFKELTRKWVLEVQNPNFGLK